MESIRAAQSINEEENSSTDDLQIKPQTHLDIIGKTASGLVAARFGEELVYVVETEMTLKEIRDYNRSPHSCRIMAVLELAQNDQQVALKIVIQNPLSQEGHSETINSLDTLLKENQVTNVKKTFKSILKALLDIRVRVPPIFYISPKFIFVDTDTYDCKIIVCHEMFKRVSPQP